MRLTVPRGKEAERLSISRLLLTLSIACVAAGAAIWISSPKDGKRGSSTSATTPVGSSTQLQNPDLRSLSKVMRTVPSFQTSPEMLPRQLRVALSEVEPDSLWGKSQRISYNKLMTRWLVPGERQVCLLAQKRAAALSASCSPPASLLTEGLMLVTISPTSRTRDHRHVFGVVPRWASQVLIRTGRMTSTLSVHRGIMSGADRAVEPPTRSPSCPKFVGFRVAVDIVSTPARSVEMLISLPRLDD